MARKVSDGKTVKVTASTAVTANSVVQIQNFIGLALNSAQSGEQVVLLIEPCEIELTVPGGVTANVGDVLYMTPTGTITNTHTGNKPFLKVTVAKDANNVVWGILLPQS